MSEIFNRVNWVDVFALILLIRISYVSSRIGVGKQILPLIFLALILIVSLYIYRDIAYFFVQRYSFNPATCKFFSYSLTTLIFAVIYHIVMRVTGFLLFRGEAGTGTIERAGGAFLGFVRSVLIIGIVMIAFLLMPIRAMETSVKNSYSGFFFINTNLKVYCYSMSFILRNSGTKIVRQDVLEQLLSKKEKYFFEPIDLKGKSRFFKDDF